jgi:hypothetical protein
MSTVLTVGDAKAALAGGPAFLAALGHIVSGTATLDDAETIGIEVLQAAALANPQLAALVTIASVAETLVPVVSSLIPCCKLRITPVTTDFPNIDPLSRRGREG